MKGSVETGAEVGHTGVNEQKTSPKDCPDTPRSRLTSGHRDFFMAMK